MWKFWKFCLVFGCCCFKTSNTDPEPVKLNRLVRQRLRKGERIDISPILACAEKFSPICQNLIGDISFVGIANVPRNYSAAFHYWKRAALAGSSDAQFSLSLVHSNYLMNDDINSTSTTPLYIQSEILAFTYLAAAAIGSHPGALLAMAFRHEVGFHVPKSCYTAATYYAPLAQGVSQVHTWGIPETYEMTRLPSDRSSKREASAHLAQVASKIHSARLLTISARKYLLGIGGLPQDYHKALQLLREAADSHYPEALGLLGYMHALGLAVPPDLEAARLYFEEAAALGDVLGINGLGVVYFFGSETVKQNHQKAFLLFNESAHLGLPDSQYNLGLMYFEGLGVPVSAVKAMVWITRALEQGHTPATYTLGKIHLEGLGNVKDCTLAVSLLKKCTEKLSWVTKTLKDSHTAIENGQANYGVFGLMRVALTGIEPATSNAAWLVETQKTSITRNIPITIPSPADETPTDHFPSIHAQLLWELAAVQGGIQAHLHLGDLAYAGKGIHRDVVAESGGSFCGLFDADGSSLCKWLKKSWRKMKIREEPEFHEAEARYRKVSKSVLTSEFANHIVARSEYNLGWMYQWGIGGIPQDFDMAAAHYRRMSEVDTNASYFTNAMALALIKAHRFCSTLSFNVFFRVQTHKLWGPFLLLATGLVFQNLSRRLDRTFRTTPSPSPSPPM